MFTFFMSAMFVHSIAEHVSQYAAMQLFRWSRETSSLAIDCLIPPLVNRAIKLNEMFLFLLHTKFPDRMHWMKWRYLLYSTELLFISLVSFTQNKKQAIAFYHISKGARAGSWMGYRYKYIFLYVLWLAFFKVGR